jgi:hypothetical protein
MEVSAVKTIHEPPKETPVVAETDVLVCGGGIAGVAAACWAARLGAGVMLLERYGFLGGLVTQSLVITTPPLNNGFGAEVASRLEAQGGYAIVAHQSTDYAAFRFHAIEPEMLKHELGRMLLEAGVQCQFHTSIVGGVVEDGIVRAVITESKAGRQAISARVFVDATGDADLCAQSGAAWAIPSVPPPTTLMFNMVGVDTDRVLAEIGNWSNLRAIVRKAVDRKDLEFDLEMTLDRGAPGVFAQDLVYPGELNVWSGNLQGVDGLNPVEHTRAEFTCREHAMRLAAYLIGTVPGFEQSRIEYTATVTGVRGTRVAQGDQTPAMDETLSTVFPNTVSKPYAHTPMRIPYGSLLPRGVEGLLVAGRCLSADPDGIGMLRLIPPCFATGHSAGVAAGLAVRDGCSPREVNITRLQGEIARSGMDLGL